MPKVWQKYRQHAHPGFQPRFPGSISLTPNYPIMCLATWIMFCIQREHVKAFGRPPMATSWSFPSIGNVSWFLHTANWKLIWRSPRSLPQSKCQRKLNVQVELNVSAAYRREKLGYRVIRWQVHWLDWSTLIQQVWWGGAVPYANAMKPLVSLQRHPIRTPNYFCTTDLIFGLARSLNPA